MDRAQRDRRVWIAIVALCVIGAAAAARRMVAIAAPATGNSPLAGLDAHFATKAGMILLHIVPSLLFVALVPLQFVSSLRNRHPRVHRWTGRVIVVLGVVLGISALRLSAHPVGGLLEGSATTLFGSFFLVCLGMAWWHIRNRRVELHREWATRMVGIALGVATTRPVMAVFFATSRLTGLKPEQFFGVAMWIGFVSTYLAAELWMRASRAPKSNGLNQNRTLPAKPLAYFQ